MSNIVLTVTQFRKKWYVSAGKSRLSRGFADQGQAQAELDKSHSFYAYWAGSAGVSVENTEPVTKTIHC